MKKILFLSAYDYSACFDHIDLTSVYIGVPKNDVLVDTGLKNNYQSIFKERYFEVSYVKDELGKFIAQLKPDVLISFGWRKIIKSEDIQSIPFKINIHPAILPQYRGYHPVPYVLINNEVEHGITAHLLTEDLDDGDIIYLKKFQISQFCTISSLQFKVNELMPIFVTELLDIVRSGNIRIEPNNSAEIKIIAPKRNPEDSEIDIHKPLAELYNYIRACDKERYPAFFYINREKVFITLSRKDAIRETPFDI